MSYTIIDLLGKLEIIERNAIGMYKSIAVINNGQNQQLVTVAKVLANEEERHAKLYEKLADQAQMQAEIEIDFDIYDKASSLVEEFKKRIINPQVQTVRELIEFAYDFEEKNSALLIDIRGRMVKSEDDSVNFNYLTLTELILEEQKHVDSLKLFLK